MTGFSQNFPPVIPASALAELKSQLGLVSDDNDALLAGYLRSALSLCEGFIGQILVQREGVQQLSLHHRRQSLAGQPVVAIHMVFVKRMSVEEQLPVNSYRVDIDGRGTGHVTLTGPLPDLSPDATVQTRYLAGYAEDWLLLPEALRHGMLMLAGHFYDQPRDGGDLPPAAVVALWRPWRRLRLA